MKRIIIIFYLFAFAFCLQSQDLNEQWFFTSSGDYPLPNFAIDTTQIPPTPFTASWLYFAGAPSAKGQFARMLGNDDSQYGLGLVNATTDSFHIHIEAYFTATGKHIFGKSSNGATGWYMTIGNNIGAWIVEFFMSGKGYIAIDTVASNDSTWKAYDIYYKKASTTLDAYVDGVRYVHNTSYSHTASAHSYSFSLGAWGLQNSVADTGQQISANYFKGGLKAPVITRYSGNRDTTYTFNFPGYGQNVYCNITSNGTYVKGYYEYDRSGYAQVAPYTQSPHMTLGLFPSNDPKDPLWVNTGTAPSYIVPLGYGVRTYGIATGSAMNNESYTNGECLWRTNFTGQGESTFVVIGGTFNTVNQSNQVLMGDSAFYIAKYNINSGKWTAIKNSQKPNTGVHGLCQWDSSLIVAGSFDSNKTILKTKGVSRFDGTNYTSLDSGINGIGVRVRVIDDTLYLGGTFDKSGNTTLNNAGRMARGGEWRAFGTGFSGIVYDFIKFQGSIYAVGLFKTANGVTVNSFGKWTGLTFTAVGRGLKLNSGAIGIAYCMAVYKNELYIGGLFDSANGVACKNLVKFNGSTFTAIGSFTMGTGQADIVELAVDSTYNHLYGIGQFTRLNGRITRAGFTYDGTNFGALPPMDMRPEGLVIANNQTSNIRYFFMGDFESVYGKNVGNIFELIKP